jgi:hypothetical protein
VTYIRTRKDCIRHSCYKPVWARALSTPAEIQQRTCMCESESKSIAIISLATRGQSSKSRGYV